jgi:hypothetical protein
MQDHQRLQHAARDAVMNDLMFIKTGAGLVPADEPSRKWFTKKKLGSTIQVDATEMRNGAFFRKWWALVQLGYDYWQSDAATIEFKGERVLPNFERFRKDVTISAGFFYPVVNLKGEVRIEPESLKWSQMTEDRFTKLYDATIQVLLQRVFNGTVCQTMTEEELRSVANQITEFAS